MGRIVPETRLEDIGKASKDLEKLSRWLFLGDSAPKDVSLSEKYGSRQAELIAQALNVWEDEAATGTRVSMNLYSREEIEKDPDKGRTHLFYLPGEAGAPWVLVCPGGAYASVQLLPEGFAPALELNRLGFHAFILRYRTARHGLFPAPLEDAAAAIRRIRGMAARCGTGKDAYALLGFSSGGHLAACWGSRELGWAKYGLPRPQALLLGYPGLSTVRSAQALENAEGSVKLTRLYLNMIAGRNWSMDDLKRWSPELHVDPDYPPTYMLHCLDDQLATPDHVRLMSAALEAAGAPYRLRMEPTGGHGFGADPGGPSEGWLEEACAFWDRISGRETAEE